MKHLSLIAIVSMLVIFVTSGCLRYEGINRGKVIDEATGEPIEGVVILAVWYKGQPTIAGTKHKFYDATEVVTDKDGEFSIKGMGLKLDRPGIPFPGFADIENMQIFIFKAGYTYYHIVNWNEFKRGMRVKNDKLIIHLKKLTMEERRKQGSPDFPTEAAVQKKMSRMLEEINKDLIEKGYSPFKFER